MKSILALAGLMVIGFSSFAQEHQEQEIVAAGIFDGTNSSALIFKECRLEVFRGDDGVLNVAAVRDRGNAYNLWVRDGSDFRLDTKTNIKTLGRQLRLTSKDAGGTKIYDARTQMNDARSYPDYGTLDVVTNAEGIPTSFTFVYARSHQGAAPYKTANTITCVNLVAR